MYRGAMGEQGAAAFAISIVTNLKKEEEENGGWNLQRGSGFRHNEIYSHVGNSNAAVWSD